MIQQQQAVPTDKYAILHGVLFSALIVGLAGDVLLRSMPWGINVGLWMAVLICALAVNAHAIGVSMTRTRWALIGGAIAYGFGFALRDSPILCSLNVLGIAACLALAGFRPGSPAVNVGAVTDYLLDYPRFWMGSVFGVFPLMRNGVDCGPSVGAEMRGLGDAVQQATRPKGLDRGGQLLRGALLAAPFLLVFGALLVSADPVFSALGQDLLNWLERDIVAHIAWSIGIGALAAGLIRQILFRSALDSRPGAPKTWIAAGDVCVALALIDVLFLTFVLVQFRTMFGGADLVRTTAHMTYTIYARSGFFELVWVAGLALPTLLFLHWLLAAETGPKMARFKTLSILMIGELLIVMASAVFRMMVYVHNCGLTEWRLYPTVFMIWLTLVLGWFIATVLRGRRDLFMFGAITSALAFGLLLDLVNPDGLVIRVNASPRLVLSPFPATYAGQLSADATPDILAVLPQLPTDQKDIISGALLNKWGAWSRDQSAWQSWNVDRSRAVSAIAAQRSALAAMNKTPYEDPYQARDD